MPKLHPTPLSQEQIEEANRFIRGMKMNSADLNLWMMRMGYQDKDATDQLNWTSEDLHKYKSAPFDQFIPMHIAIRCAALSHERMAKP